MSLYENYKECLLKTLREANEPLAIETLRVISGIKCWETAKALLLELVMEGKVVGLKTSKSWIFGMPEVMEPIMIKKNKKGGEEIDKN
jgi:hypothetical protein